VDITVGDDILGLCDQRD